MHNFINFWSKSALLLDPRSAKPTTFITLFGTYYYNRFPYGITSTPKHFHRRILEILTGVTGTVSMIDDVLVFSKNQKEHDKHLAVAIDGRVAN